MHCAESQQSHRPVAMEQLVLGKFTRDLGSILDSALYPVSGTFEYWSATGSDDKKGDAATLTDPWRAAVRLVH